MTKLTQFLAEANITNLRCKDARIIILVMFNSPSPKDTETFFTMTDKTGKRFPVDSGGSVWYWDYSNATTRKEVLNCEFMDAEKLVIPNTKRKLEYFAGILDKKFVIIDSNNKVVISAKSFDDLMYDYVESAGRYPIEGFPDVNSKEGSDAYYEYNSDYYQQDD